MDVILQHLKSINPFPYKSAKNKGVRRPMVYDKDDDYKYHHFALGKVNQINLPLERRKVESRHNKKHPELLRLCDALIKQHDPDFTYTTVQINKNHQCPPHKDKYNKGLSWIVGLGDYTGGELVVGETEYDIHNTFVQMDGRIVHYTKPFNGERYSIVFLTL